MPARISSIGFLKPFPSAQDKPSAASIAGIDAASLEALPAYPGVYRFLDARGSALYIGKSVNIRTRVQAHLRTPAEGAMLRRTRRIDFIRTAGEVGALLLESQLIKKWQPPFNVLLKSAAPAYALHLPRGSLQPLVVDYEDGARDRVHGLFGSRRTAEAGWRAQVKRHGLCPSLLGIEKTTLSRGCFARQLGQCRGACIGLETPSAHKRRVHRALRQLDRFAWPYAGPIGIAEDDGQLHQVHVVQGWAYLGSLSASSPVLELPAVSGLDVDTFKILSAPLAAGLLKRVDLQILHGERGTRSCRLAMTNT